MSSAKILPFLSHGLPQVLPAVVPIKLQLERILRSPGFVRAERMRRFLSFVVEETLAGRSNQVCEYSIGVSVFEKRESFEPAIDPIVRNDARRLRAKLTEYYQATGRASEVVIEIPKGTYVPSFRPGSHAPEHKQKARYKLIVSLVRVEDNVALWSTEQDINSEHLLPRFPI